MEIGLDIRSAELLQRRIEEAVQGSGPVLRPVLLPVLRRPAKRLRPALLLAMAGERRDRAAISCAAAVELLHISSLVHDDLMDEAPQRGGVRSVHVTHGAGMAIVAGDLLVAESIAALGEVDPRCATDGLRAYAEMCRGQAGEVDAQGRFIDVDEHLEILSGKTAALLSAACSIGAVLAGDPAGPAARFGRSLGMLFQIVDDLIDLCATAAEAGKPVGQDLANGVYTLPALLAARRYGTAFTEALDSGELDAARDLAREGGILAEVLRYARGYATAAEESLCELPARPGLAVLPGELFERATRLCTSVQRATVPAVR
ncbi:polyprenyl synthetase family protein [Actinoplanes regularis]|uniref:polyprenyl synthetase family protein n=1 Tax=Actinoplanes regularis TaxID=52697 RepID=UPI0024A0C6AF|nr:polyprenyl synthetase family protein [Actinoplanes regularis]GLW33342.1 geranylgeranyl pyrophosphate synthase [Actinoplanes regularis]